MIESLYFIWNADWSIGGALQAGRDFVRGVESCALCDIAYQGVRQKSDWKACKAEISVPIQTLYKNQAEPELINAAQNRFPVVIAQSSAGLVKLLDKEEIEACHGDVQSFKQKLTRSMDAFERSVE